MNKKLLNKNIHLFYKQALAENLLPLSQSNKQKQRKKSMLLALQGGATGRHMQRSRSGLSKYERIKQAESQILRKFLREKFSSQHLNTEDFKINSIDSSCPKCPKGAHEEQSRRFDLKAIDGTSLLSRSGSSEGKQTGAIGRTNLSVDNAYLLLPIEQIRNILLSKQIERQSPSELKKQILESKKIRFLYGNLSNRDLQRLIRQGRQLPGNAGDNLLALLESRLDVVLERCALFSSIRSARQSVTHKQVQVNSRVVNLPGHMIQPGDVIRVFPLEKPFRNTAKDELTRSAISRTDLRELVVSKSDLTAEDAIKSTCRLGLTKNRYSLPSQCNRKAAALEGSVQMLPPAFSCRPGWHFVVSASILSSLLQLECNLLATAWQKNGSSLPVPLLIKHTQQPRLKERYCQAQGSKKEARRNLPLINKMVQNSELQIAIKKETPFSFSFMGQLSIEQKGARSPLQERVLQGHKEKNKDEKKLSLQETVYNTYSYWLELRKNLFSNKHKQRFLHHKSEQGYREDTKNAFKEVAFLQQKRCKALHLELSYQSCTVIFLYPPQRVYLAALVDVDLLTKSF